MAKSHWALAALITLVFATPAVPAEPARDLVDVVVVYDSIPGEMERARTAALGARINCEFDNLPVRALSIPAAMFKAIGEGEGVQSVSIDASIGPAGCPTLAKK